MTVTDQQPTRRTAPRAFLTWIVAIAVILAFRQLRPLVERMNLSTGALTFASFIAWVLVVAISLYWIAAAIRWMLRKLFWRVGRRLFLSYVLVGLLPFLLMSVLLLAIVYMEFGVMSHAGLRGARQATLGQMESWGLEYSLTGKQPADRLATLEIFDSANATGKSLPPWLRHSSFSGMAWRDNRPLLVAARQFPQPGSAEPRSIVFVQPLDEAWARQLEDKANMIVTYDRGKTYEKQHATVQIGNKSEQYDLETEKGLDQIFKRGAAIDRVIWWDLNALTEWQTGVTDKRHQLMTFISTPYRSIFQYYFGASSGRYMLLLQNILLGLVTMLAVVYLIAALFAAVLIFSISRAVNRIEKGTKAVERGDFTYRIRMKPYNQLGQMAQSFDRMTESIGSLLTTVAEKERLQSEIEIAATIQRNLLPKEGPQARGVSFSAHFEPTASIGGDYYDVFNLDKSRLAVAIGDVSGHGLSTGLVMAMVKAAITTLVEEGADETSLFRRLNELVYRSTERRAFMTLAFTIFDLEHGRIRHTNAGHLYPYLLRKGQSAPLSIESPSFPLGVRSELTTRTVELDLEDGDTIVYLSDGIVEAQDEEGEPFGFDQLEKLLEQQADRGPSAVRDVILSAVAAHSGSRPADDDRTIMVLRFEKFRTAPLVAQSVELPALA